MLETDISAENFLVEYGNKNLTIAFAGLSNGLHEVRHDFYNLTSGESCSKIFCKDPSELWYQSGVDSKLDSIEKLLTRLKEEVAIIKPEKITCIGISAGGHAALLFGALLNVDIVHAFGPQAFLSAKNWKKFNMGIFLQEKIDSLHSRYGIDGEYFDIKRFLEKTTKPIYNIHVCQSYIWDLKQTYYLGELPNVRVVEYDCNEHAPASYLKRVDKLKDVILIK